MKIVNYKLTFSIWEIKLMKKNSYLSHINIKFNCFQCSSRFSSKSFDIYCRFLSWRIFRWQFFFFLRQIQICFALFSMVSLALQCCCMRHKFPPPTHSLPLAKRVTLLRSFKNSRKTFPLWQWNRVWKFKLHKLRYKYVPIMQLW